MSNVKKGYKAITDTGLLDAFEHVIRTLAKFGLPKGDLYEFAAI